MSMFNPADFLNTEVSEANSTKRELCPAGMHLAVIDKIEARPWTKKDDPTKSGVTLEVTWSIQNQEVLTALDQDKVTVRQGVMLDFNEAGGLDTGKGKNIGLGRLREALGLNVPGVPFVFNQLVGRMANVVVQHEVDKADAEKVYDRVQMVAPAA